MARTRIPSELWTLPRPRRNKYPGGFPLHFEKKLILRLGLDPAPARVLHPFGGQAEYGIKVDLESQLDNLEEPPHYLGDAHDLRECLVYGGEWDGEKFGDPPPGLLPAPEMFADDQFDLVICDPPFGEEWSRELWGVDAPSYKRYSAEAVRVCKPGGFVAMYHWTPQRRPAGTRFVLRLAIEPRIGHKLRSCRVFQKEEKVLDLGWSRGRRLVVRKPRRWR